MAKKIAKKASSKETPKAKSTAKKAPVKAAPPAKAAAKKTPAAKPVVEKTVAPKVTAKTPLAAAKAEKPGPTLKLVEKVLETPQPAQILTKSAEKPAKKAAVEKETGPKLSAKEKRAEAARVQLAADTDARWADLKDKHGKEKASKYSMTAQFQANQGLEHPKLGWGFILSNNNDRLEVLFQDGIKILISNYNSSQKI